MRADDLDLLRASVAADLRERLEAVGPPRSFDRAGLADFLGIDPERISDAELPVLQRALRRAFHLDDEGGA
ncbi:MAG: hypothetical protein ACREK5_10035 [Gemmatimonadota bacterium]